MGKVTPPPIKPTLAAVAIIFFAQKCFIQGVTLTGIKG